MKVNAENYLRFIYTLSILFYFIASVLFFLFPMSTDIYHRLTPHFIVCIIFSTVLTFVIWIFGANTTVLYLVFTIKAFIFLIIGIPFGENLSIEFLLLCVLIIEIVFYCKIVVGTALSSILILIAVLFQRNFYAWNTAIYKPQLSNIITFLLLAIFILTTSLLIKHLTEHILNIRKINMDLNKSVQNLSSANISFQVYAESIEKVAISSERKRITKEIHDIIGYTLTSLIVMMESAIDFSKKNSRKTEELLEKSRELAENGLDEIRYSLRLLRSLGSERQKGLKALHRMISVFSENTGVNIDINYGNIPWTFREDIDMLVRHIIQESLVNSLRHGNATRIKISFSLIDSQLKIFISDNGKGSPTSTKDGIGFTVIKEEISKRNGEFKAVSLSNGFEIYISIPLD